MARELSSLVDQLGKEKSDMDLAFSNQSRQILDMAQAKKSMELKISRLASRLHRAKLKQETQKSMILQLQEQIAELEEIVGSDEVSEANTQTDDEDGTEDEDGEEEEGDGDGGVVEDGVEDDAGEDYNPLMH
jgi:chromosome segregation ATPase